jgi:hypothetical protein
MAKFGRRVDGGCSMGNEPAEAVFHAGMLLQLYDETKNVDEVTQVATALLATRTADHVRRVAWLAAAGAPQTETRSHRPVATFPPGAPPA